MRFEWEKNERRSEQFSFLSFSAKKLAKQVERFQVQLSDEKSRNRELSAQLTEAADYKARNFIPYFSQSDESEFFEEYTWNVAIILSQLTTIRWLY